MTDPALIASGCAPDPDSVEQAARAYVEAVDAFNSHPEPGTRGWFVTKERVIVARADLRGFVDALAALEEVEAEDA
jgi:hypothetical protein